MESLRKLCAVIVLTVVIGLNAFAGQTDTPPCAPPAPGQTDTPPCVAVPIDDSTATGETGAMSSDSTDIVSFAEVVFDMLTLY